MGFVLVFIKHHLYVIRTLIMFKVRSPYQLFFPWELSLFCEIIFEKIDFGGKI
jgi:hypothetical protein